jgi:hypothetical protein
VIIGGRNMDHTLCLYVEEGESRDKTVEKEVELTEVKMAPEVSSEVAMAWVRSAYDGT